MKSFWKRAALMLAGTALVMPGTLATASSHSDAPLIKLDPQANLTDVYAFIRNRPEIGDRVLVVEVSVRPFSEPGDGVNYEAFSDDALYSIHIANPTTGAQLQRYDFKFSPVSTNGMYKNLDTILRYGRGANLANGNPDAGAIMNVGDNHQNFVQTYTLTTTIGSTTTTTTSAANGSPLMVPPPNVGPRTTPFYNDVSGSNDPTMNNFNANFGFARSGFSSRGTLDRYTAQTVYDLAALTGQTAGVTTFCGPRDDGFYSDIPGIFDLLDSRIVSPSPATIMTAAGTLPALGQQGGGVDGFKGFNVLHYAIEIPLSQLPAPMQFVAPFTNGMAPGIGNRLGVGVYASVSRPRITLRSTSGQNANSGPFIQVNREANPLFNEGLVAQRDKDNYNRTSPTDDAQYAKYAQNPELAVLINAVLFKSATPTTGPLATTGRADLALVYIPDVIRVDTTTGPVRASGEAGFSRFGFLGGDTVMNSAGAAVSGGWPNGRRVGDDVVDIALTAVASGPTYSSITVVGDNVSSNDMPYNTTFPYVATPQSGTRNRKDSNPAQ